VVAAIAYELAEVDAPVDEVVRRFYKGEVGPYWPPDRAHIETGYRNIPWPFEPLEPPIDNVPMVADWTLDQMVGYIGTWSAVVRFRKATGRDPLPSVRTELEAVWGEPARAKRVSWPLVLLTGRVD
jgi:hypothetical protein